MKHTVAQGDPKRAVRAAPFSIEALPQPAWICSPDARRFRAVNEAAVRHYGYTRAEFLAMELEDVCPPEAIRSIEAEGAEAGLPSGPWPHRRKDGTTCYMEASVRALDGEGRAGRLVLLHDVTRHVAVQEDFRRMKAFYANVLDDLPIDLAVVDPEARILYLNATSVPDPELRAWLIGKTGEDYCELRGLDPAIARRRAELVREAVAARQPRRLEEAVPSRRNGALRYVLRIASPVLGEDGEVERVLGYGIDITERKRYEQQLVAAREKAEELNRLTTALLANMSHEIRTPLASILGFAQVLAEELPGEQRALVQTIERSGKRLMNTLNTVLDLALIESRQWRPSPTWLDVVSLIRQVVASFQDRAQEYGLALRFAAPAEKTMPVYLDPEALLRVVNNLISNAIKFTPTGGVTVEVRADETHVEVSVADTGIGISTEFLPRLYDKFAQESAGETRVYEGSGLGLSIVKRLVELMGGTIRVASQKGSGSTFVVRLPRH